MGFSTRRTALLKTALLKTALLLGGGPNLGLGSAPDLLHSVLPFLLLFSADLCWEGDDSLSGQPVLWLKLLGKVHGVVDESKPTGLAATEVSLEAEGKDQVFLTAVQL